MSDDTLRADLAIALAKLADCPEWLTPEQIELLKSAGVGVPEILPVIAPALGMGRRAVPVSRRNPKWQEVGAEAIHEALSARKPPKPKKANKRKERA